MSEAVIQPMQTLQPWELDPTIRDGSQGPDDLAAWLERHRKYRERLEICQRCPRLGAGALCAAEIPWPDPGAARMGMENCAGILQAGERKPEHGLRHPGVIAVSQIYRRPRG